jgi:hypothetical protein
MAILLVGFLGLLIVAFGTQFRLRDEAVAVDGPPALAASLTTLDAAVLMGNLVLFQATAAARFAAVVTAGHARGAIVVLTPLAEIQLVPIAQ